MRPTSVRDPTPTTPVTEPTKILIIDDDPFVTTSTQMILERSGYQVLTTDSLDCVDLVARENPRLVLLDLHMPGVSGQEAARRLNALRPGFTGRVVFHSADEPDTLRVLAEDAGIDGFITKSSSVRELTAQVEKLLRPAGTVRKPCVVVLEADPARREALTRRYEREGAEVRALAGPFCVNLVAMEDVEQVVIGRTAPALSHDALERALAAVPGLRQPRVVLAGSES